MLFMKVLYAGKTGNNLVKSLQNTLKANLPQKVECRIERFWGPGDQL